jgi:glycosyltransferase involved in cell wall biosynthesis
VQAEKNGSWKPLTLPKTTVLIIVENLPVPFDRRVWQEARALAEAGYRVFVICPKSRGFEKSRETLEGIEIYRHRLWEAAGPMGYLVEYAWALAAQLWLAVKIYARARFNIIHACNPPDTIFLVALFFKLFGVRFIFDHHDLSPELFEAKFGRRRWFICRLVWLAERWTFRSADASIATNESYREIALTRGGMKPGRVFIVRSSPDLAKVQRVAAQPELKRGRAHLVVYLGTMGPQEGVDLLLQSAAHLIKQKNRRDVSFVLIGGGSEIPRLKAQVAEKGLGDFVTFAGRIPDDELAAYLSTAEVCVAPDPKNPMNDKSTMNKILEYMAYARPVVLFDLTEGRRSAEDAALYARPDDPVDFAEKITDLLDSEPLRLELGARGRKRIEERLNWKMEQAALLAAYEAALDSRPPTY